MKLALLVYDIGLTGGAERVALNLATEFSNIHQTHLISFFDRMNACSSIYSFHTYVLSDHNVSITVNLIKLSSKLRKYILSNKIDILIAITAGVVTVADLAAIRTNTRVIYAEHSNLENKTYGKKHQLRQLIGAKTSDVVVTLTNRDKDNFIKSYKLSERKVCEIPNWYIPNIEESKEYRALSKRIISVGRLEKVKGFNYLIEVAEKIHLQFPDWKWDIYGEGTLHEEIQRQIDRNDLNNFLELKGNVTGLSHLYKNYSIYVMTSLYEGLPMSLLEAQAAGLPIVSFDCPTGPAEIVENGINGIIVEAYNVKKMAEALTKLMENVELRERYASKAKINLQQFSKKNVMQNG